MKRRSLKWPIILACIIFWFDRLAKYLVSAWVQTPVDITNWFSIDYVLNRGISWGLLAFTDTLGFILISSFIAIMISIIIWWTYQLYLQHEPITAQLLIIAGGVSNLVDRVTYSGVIDYLGITVIGWHFPWFNIADVAINVGVAMLIFQGIYYE